jgi:hypothetical protein
MEVSKLSTILGTIVLIVGGTVGTLNYFVSKDEHSRDIKDIKRDAQQIAEANADYLLDLRIEQKEEMQLRLEEKAEKEPLDVDDKQRLQRTREQLKKLYQIQEENR